MSFNWKALVRYYEDGDLAIDNNGAKRSLRGVVIGRNNCPIGDEDAWERMYRENIRLIELRMNSFASSPSTRKAVTTQSLGPSRRSLQGVQHPNATCKEKKFDGTIAEIDIRVC